MNLVQTIIPYHANILQMLMWNQWKTLKIPWNFLLLNGCGWTYMILTYVTLLANSFRLTASPPGKPNMLHLCDWWRMKRCLKSWSFSKPDMESFEHVGISGDVFRFLLDDLNDSVCLRGLRRWKTAHPRDAALREIAGLEAICTSQVKDVKGGWWKEHGWGALVHVREPTINTQFFAAYKGIHWLMQSSTQQFRPPTSKKEQEAWSTWV